MNWTYSEAACDDVKAVALARRMSWAARHEPFDYPTLRGTVEEEMPKLLDRLDAIGHPYAAYVRNVVEGLTCASMPLEAFHRLCAVVHFEFLDSNGEEARV